MISLNLISLLILAILLSLILTLSFLDYRKKRILKTKPFLSFLVPCYNDGDSVKETIESIYNSYDRKKFEIIVVNDCSRDNSLEVLNETRRKYPFVLVNNKKNLGKSCSINNICRLAKSGILFFLDADVILNRQVIVDILARLQQEKVAAVSSPYQPENRGFLALMQEIEYIKRSFLQGAHNWFSTISLWGGCFAVKRKAFEEVNRFSENAIVEDSDLALKLKKAGYRVEQSFFPVKTYVPATINSWYKQKIRWASGGAQNFIKHFSVWIKSPLYVLFTVLFSALSLLFVVSFTKEITFLQNIFYTFFLLKGATFGLLGLHLIGLSYSAVLLKNLLATLYFAAFSVPYVIPMISRFRQAYKMLYVIPFALVYMPVFTLVSVIGFAVGLYRYRSLKKGGRGW